MKLFLCLPNKDSLPKGLLITYTHQRGCFYLPNLARISSDLGRKSLSGARFLCRSSHLSLNSALGIDFHDMGCLGFGFGAKCFDFVLGRAVSGGGDDSDGGFGRWGDGSDSGEVGYESGWDDLSLGSVLHKAPQCGRQVSGRPHQSLGRVHGHL